MHDLDMHIDARDALWPTSAEALAWLHSPAGPTA